MVQAHVVVLVCPLPAEPRASVDDHDARAFWEVRTRRVQHVDACVASADNAKIRSLHD